MRGQRTPTKEVYQIMMSLVLTRNQAETARILGIPRQTVINVYNQHKDKPEFKKLEQEVKNDFVLKADGIINKALNRLDKELDSENTIPVNQLTTAIGTLYDKRALAQGDSTSNVKNNVEIDKDTRELLENVAKRLNG